MISVVISTCGDPKWKDLAMARAYPSVFQQDCEIITEHYPDLTVEQARNRAARLAKRPWLCFLDADDELDSGYIAAMQNAIRHNEWRHDLYAPIVSYVEQTPEGMSLVNEPDFPNAQSTMPPLNHCVTGTVVNTAQFWGVGGWKDGYWPWPDYELWLRCISDGAAVRYTRKALYLAHVNPQSDNRTLQRKDGVRLASRIHLEHRRRLDAAHHAGVVPAA
jgi:glycosyltransferase involved in cell wall biosynthesis